MVYEIEFSKRSKKELDSLEKDIAIRILKKLREITNNPSRYIKRLKGGIYSLRVGDYRILLIIQENIIYIVKVGHRRNVYGK